jgi:hypothetical protein
VQVEALRRGAHRGPIRWDRGTIGHDARADLRLGVRNGLVLAGALFDVIAPVEDWQLTDTEAGLASLPAHRDMRDWYGRHGGRARSECAMGEEVSLSVAPAASAGARWTQRRPFTCFRDARPGA